MKKVTCCSCAEEAVVCCEDGEWRCTECALDACFDPDTGEVAYPESEEEYLRGGK